MIKSLIDFITYLRKTNILYTIILCNIDTTISMDFFLSTVFYAGGSYYLILYRSWGRVSYHTYPTNSHEHTFSDLVATGNVVSPPVICYLHFNRRLFSKFCRPHNVISLERLYVFQTDVSITCRTKINFLNP